MFYPITCAVAHSLATKVFWSDIDETAAREGAAAARLRLSTGAQSPAASELHHLARNPQHDRRCAYRRLSAIEAFDRLFSGRPDRRREPTAVNSDRQRQYRARRKVAALAA